MTPLAPDSIASARAVALHYATDEGAGITRVRRGKSFQYLLDGKAVRDKAVIERIKKLAIPPAWTKVWISKDPDAHLQATGRDARGRKQYRYHPKWRSVRDESKYHRLVAFCRALPKLRQALEEDMACTCLCKTKVVATIVSLMERAQLRVGNDEYTRTNGTYGATTLQDRHAKIKGSTLELAYRGKSGVERRIRLNDRRLATIVRRCRDLPGQRLFQYIDGDQIRPITSTDVNEYLRERTGGPFTAKDFRTWAATIGAAMLLCTLEHPGNERECKKCVAGVIKSVASVLGHTPAVCRASYIHPRIVDDFTTQALPPTLGKQIRRRVGDLKPCADHIAVEALRSIEPLVATYLDTTIRKRKRA